MSTRLSYGVATGRPIPRGAVAALLAALAAPLAPASAQRASSAPQRAVAIETNDGGAPYAPPRRGFSLFGNSDFAASGMRVSGNMSYGVSNIGPCSEGAVVFNENGCGAYNSNSSTFEIVLGAGVPPHDFRKIRSVYQGVNGHLGPQGYTQLSSHLRVGAGSQDWGPADRTLGTLFSGVTSTNDGSCRDNSGRANNFMLTGVSLLAASDCPPTWAGGGFQGARTVSDQAFVNLAAQQGNAFTFDFWRVAEEDLGSGFSGNFQTYGKISDHYAEHIGRYGSVTPLGTGRPSVNGFPLGLDIDFQAFTFNRPNIADVVFYQMQVINRSEDVYGTGIDYDSLYMGIMPGWLLNADQNPAIYADPSRNLLLAYRNGQNIGCNGAITGIPAVIACQNQGFRNDHGMGIIMLKSPIGDTRNKLMTRPGMFNNPTSPYADDTITFNHHHGCGFGANCFSSTIAENDRRGFGMISSTEANVLDGRDPGSITANQQWVTFRPKAHPAQPNARFNRYVPGSALWEYENKPFREEKRGQADTIFFDACEGEGLITINGVQRPSCAVPFSDTLPGKQNNAGPGNIGGVMTAGPFPLGAGDTTSFVIAFLAARDSSSFEALVSAATDAYLSFYLGPDAPPYPVVTSVVTASAEEVDPTGGDPAVTLTFSDAPESATDPFLERFAQDLRTSADPFFVRLRTFNPELADTVAARAPNNFSQLWIFKSCDGGATYTNDADCAGDPTNSPTGTLGLGWQPYAILTADENGDIDNTFTDAEVVAGRTYLYSLVPRSRGLRVDILAPDPADVSAGCQADLTACRTVPRQLVIADTSTATIQSSGPSTARVYVPVSLTAGATPGRFVATNREGNATVPLNVVVGSAARTGDYRMLFGNRFVIEQKDSAGTVTATVRVQDVIDSATVTGAESLTSHVEKEDVLSGPGRLDIAGVEYTPVTSSYVTASGSTVTIEVDTIAGFGFALAQGARPYFLSFSLDNSATSPTTPPSFLNRADFPGFLINAQQNTSNSIQAENIIRPNGDTLPALIRNSNSVQLQEATSTRRQGRGMYTFDFSDDAFGPGVPFNNLGTAEAVTPQVAASLAARAAPTTGDTTAAVLALLQAVDPTFTNLRPAKFPFTVINAAGDTAILAFPRRTNNTLVLGNGSDTLRVAVDSLTWLPGDRFFILEEVERDSVIAGKVVTGPDGRRITKRELVVAFAPVFLGCNTPRVACNPVPVTNAGGTGYQPFANDWRLVIDYPFPYTVASEVALRIEGVNTAAAFERRDLNKIRVVPNPFVVQSQYNQLDAARTGTPRLVFAGVPATGTLRIYTVSGQFLQQLTWQPGDLLPASGDLPWDLRTREGTLISSGLYIYVITANDASGKQQQARGKFVVIR